MLKNFLSRQSGLFEATAILAVASLVSRIFGLIRDKTLAAHLGAGPISDSYFAAFKVPDLIFQLLILGAISSAFIPVFVDYWRRNGHDRSEAWGVVNTLVNVGVVLLAAIISLAAVFAPTLAHVVAPGFGPEQLDMVAALMRVMLLSPLFFGISNLAGGILNSFKNFWAYALAPILYNIGIIIGIVYFLPIVGFIGLAYGVVLGAFLHMLVQIPGVFAFGYRYRLHVDLHHPVMRKMAVLMVPRILGLGVVQLNIVISTAFATKLGEGSVSVLNYAENLYSLPISIFGISFAVAIFPLLAEKYSLQKLDEFKDDFVQVLRQILFFIVPTMVLYWLLRAQIVRLVYGYDAFAADWDATRFTVSVLAFLTFGMVAHAVIPLLARSFYALQDTRTPLLTSLVALVVNVGMAWWLIQHFNVVGLAAALSIAGLVNMILLMIFINRRLPNIPWGSVGRYFSWIVLSSVAMGGSGYAMLRVVDLLVDTHRVWGLLAQTAITLVVCVLVYLVLAKLFRIPETKIILKPITLFTSKH